LLTAKLHSRFVKESESEILEGWSRTICLRFANTVSITKLFSRFYSFNHILNHLTHLWTSALLIL